MGLNLSPETAIICLKTLAVKYSNEVPHTVITHIVRELVDYLQEVRSIAVQFLRQTAKSVSRAMLLEELLDAKVPPDICDAILSPLPAPEANAQLSITSN